MNVNGSSLGNPGPFGGGGVAKDHLGDLIFAFHSGYGISSNGQAETKVFWEALSHCKAKGLNKVELVSDSKSVVEALSKVSSPSWVMWYWWTRIKSLKDNMEICFSYSPRESNAMTDDLTQMGSGSQAHSSFQSIAELPPLIKGLLFLDKVGL
ncbi:uncharacterized protein LOC131227371 [Magnolia sinica]|uniref:uncharacterized protein LOC131227371 n=1 Tax=Magnolia sinica TaxID=86752 RepID=UPI0026593986|nr:uncharacterized protein LOC131227371 [Magnolia sinica]